MINIIEIDDTRRNLWDTGITKFENVHPLNAYGWGKVRAIDGWSPTYLLAKSRDSITGAVMLLTKRIPFTGFSIMYAPRGALFDFYDNTTLKFLLNRIRIEARKKRSIFLRIDPNIAEGKMMPKDSDPFLLEGFVHLPNRWSMWNAPCDVYRTDLSKVKNEQQLFDRINPKARTGVRKAEKDGVTIRQGTSLNDIRTFYNIFKYFSIQKGFMHRTFEYQKRLFYQYILPGNGALFLAVYSGSVVGGQICIGFGSMCVEMHRCVGYKYHRHRINEALVWEGMKWAQKKGYTWYCQRGEGSPALAKFKKKFDAQLTHLVGYYDFPFRQTLYSYFTFFEFKVLPIIVSLAVKRLKTLRNFATRLAGKDSPQSHMPPTRNRWT